MLQVADNIKKFSNKVRMIIIITHDPEFILNCCNYVVEIEGGVVKQTCELNKENSEKIMEFFTI